MAPEQALGKIVDKRADIWAFGAVLYEMLTSERAFKGEDISDTLAAWFQTQGVLLGMQRSDTVTVDHFAADLCAVRQPVRRAVVSRAQDAPV